MVRYGGDGDLRDPAGERWREARRSDPRLDPRPDPRFDRASGSLEQRLDRWVSAGRQLVDGVAGARPGSRPPARPGGLGRWLEDRMDWLLDDGDDWREPWQEGEPAPPPRRRPDAVAPPAPFAPSASVGPAAPARRRGLEAISRRVSTPAAPAGTPPAGTAPAGTPPAAPAGDWPDDASFTVPRWQRPAPAPRPLDDLAAPPPPPAAPGRPLPRSTRRRP